VGYRRVNLNTQIDDMFLETEICRTPFFFEATVALALVRLFDVSIEALPTL
jgi:hypothetical protein